MRYSPILDRLAALPLEMLVKPAEQQHDEHQTACFCPFCKGKSITPHFIIYKEVRGGLYGTPVQRWACTQTKRSGYGAIELQAAIMGTTLEGDNLRLVCAALAKKAGLDIPELAFKDWRTTADRPQNEFSFLPTADFTPQELNALGCKVTVDFHNKIKYGFDTFRSSSDWHFMPSMLNKDFRVWSLNECTLPAVSRKGEMVSEVIHGMPWNPLFICFMDDTRQTGCIFRPATDMPPMVFSNNEEDTPTKISRRLTGDAVFSRALQLRDETTSGVARAIKELQPDEDYQLTEEVWEGNEQVTTEIDEKDVKARNVIFCNSAQDAISTYYHLVALRHTYPDGAMGKGYYHVAFTFGKENFSSVHYRKLKRFADRVYTLFPNDMRSLRYARAIGRKYRDVWRAELPPSFKSIAHQMPQRLYCRPVTTVRDFFLSYRMGADGYQYDDDINKLFKTCLASALTTNPFEYKEKRDRKGVLKDKFYVINTATVWEFMAGEGYVRDVRPDTPDKIGRYVHLDWPFVDELDVKSMVAKTNECLVEYARQVARPGTDDFVLMRQAVAKSKEINEKSITAIPAMTVDYSGGYGAGVDHFFYKNGALRITPDTVTLIPYSQITFNVDRGEVMPWNFVMPVKTHQPFAIIENPEYKKRQDEIENHKILKDDQGRPQYSIQQLAQERSELMSWARTHRWLVDFNGKREDELWPALRVLRGFANEHWNEEEDLIRDGKCFTADRQAELNGHFANLIFCLGRMLWRYRDSHSNCITYLMENTVENEQKAQGGSGKSAFVNVFAACAGHVLNINGKDLKKGEFALNLAEYRPHVHRIVHWEDCTKSFTIDSLYNYATSGFVYRQLFGNQVTVPLSESPGHVVTSNYPPSNTDESTMRRICIGGFSHRFCGDDAMKNKAGRQITALMPDFHSTGSPDGLKTETKNQIAYICALAVQFVMKYDERVDAPQEDLKYRALVRSLGESFVRWAEHFFAQEWVYNAPVDMDSAMQEYVSEYSDSSDSKMDKFSRKAFYQRVLDYCQTINVICNPEHLYEKGKKEEKRHYFILRAWVTNRYFYGKEWQGDHTVQPKQIRELEQSQYVVFFYRTTDVVPADRDELMQRYREYCNRPDPAPILDENGDAVTLTEEERQRWRDYKDRKQGKRTMPPMAQTTTTSNPDPLLDADAPF